MDLERSTEQRHCDPTRLVGLSVVLFVSLLLAACSVEQSKQYTIIVEYLPIELDEQAEEDSRDYSTATISIMHVDGTESDVESQSELIVSPFQNGRVALRGQIEHPMWVEVLAESDAAANTLKLRTFVEPGESVSVAVVDFKIPFYEDMIAHVGTLTNVQDPEKKFTLLADFNLSKFDTQNVIAEVTKYLWDEKGIRQWAPISSILVQDGRFHVEVEVEDPIVLSVEIGDLRTFFYSTRLIAESGTTIRLEPSRHTAYTSEYLTTGWFQAREDTSQSSQRQELVAIADAGRHKRLVESWRRSFTYRLKQKQLEKALAEEAIRFDELAKMRPHLDEASEIPSEDKVVNPTEDSWVKIDPAKGCEHVDLSQVRQDEWNAPLDSNRAQSDALYEEIFDIEFATLNDIARRARDPLDSLLALELGAWYSLDDRSEAINILDGLAPSVSPTVAEERIAPVRKFLSAIHQSEKNEPLRVPGQRAPDFELSNLHGTSQRLSEIVRENELVLLEFIRNPEYYTDYSQTLSSLYDEYRESGLQIVTVLYGVETDQDQEVVANLNNTWIELLDPQINIDSDVALSFAAVHRRMDYVIDSNGCFVQRSLNHVNLRGFLDSYFDIPESTELLEDVSSP